MPELPEVEIARRNLTRWAKGRAITRVELLDSTVFEPASPDLRPRHWIGQRLEDVRRHGKYLVAELSRGTSLVIHFRMTGKLVESSDPEIEYGRLAIQFDEQTWVVLRDMRRLAHVDALASENLDSFEPLAKLGPDALSISPETFASRLPPGRMIKTALLDQQVVAGLGNIAASEVLWEAEIDPTRKCGGFERAEIVELGRIVEQYLHRIIERDSGESITYVAEDASQNPFQVYRRAGQPCPRCGSEIERESIGGRSTYICEECQRG